MMGSDEPPFLEVDTEVSAKFRGAFCEAKIKAAKKIVKCKVLFKDNSDVAAVSHETIEGELKLNGTVKVKSQDREPQEATIIKMTDNSLYTVVFDDGDERTLRRTNICLKGERHFQEDETLDHLPLTDPENFGTPVLRGNERKKRRRRFNSHNSNDDDDDDSIDDDVPFKRKYENLNSYVGKVVCVEQGERKKSWFPALCLRKDFADNGMVVGRDEILVQSFKDNKKICINKASIKEFSKEKEPLASFIRGDVKIEPILKAGIEKAVAYHDNGELPKGWTVNFSDDDETNRSERDDDTESVDEEPIFLSKLYKFMEDQGTPIVKTPYLGNQEVNLCKLYQLVMNLNGMDEVSNQSKWRTIYSQLGIPTLPTTASYNIKNLYKKYLYPYEEHTRKAYEEEKKRREELIAIAREDTERSKRRLTRPRGRRNSGDWGEKNIKRSKDGFDSSKLGDVDYKGGSDADVDDEYSKSHEMDDLVDVVNSPQSSGLSEDSRDFFDFKGDGDPSDGRYLVNTRVLVKYGKGRNQRTYEAKIVDIDTEIKDDTMYYVHYTGWNTRYDEWVKLERIVGLSTNPPTRKRGQSSAPLKPIKEKEKEKESPPVKKVEPITPVTPVASPSSAKSTPRQAVRRSPVHHSSEKAKSPFPNHLNDAPGVEVKPSPCKPRMTRNSMQDTFLLTAIEESIAGKTRSLTKSRAFTSQSSGESNGDSNGSHSSESSVGSENGCRKTRRQGRRRLGRPPKSDVNSDSDSAKEDNDVSKNPVLEHKESDEEEDFGDEEEEDERTVDNSNEDEQVTEVKEEPVDDSFAPEPIPSSEITDVTEEADENKSKDSRAPKTPSKSESVRNGKGETKNEPRFPNTRNGKTRASVRQSKRRPNGEENDVDAASELTLNKVLEICKESSNAFATEQLGKMEAAENLLSVSLGHLTDMKPPVASLTTDTGYTDVSQQRLRKENPATVKPPDTKDERPASQNSFVEKDKERKKRRKEKKEKHRRRRSISASLSSSLDNPGNESSDSLQSPSRNSKEKNFCRFYDGPKIDFVSDLGSLASLDPSERIQIIQNRLLEMKKLYGKLKAEVANIDRRKRRKMRKQMEAAAVRNEAMLETR